MKVEREEFIAHCKNEVERCEFMLRPEVRRAEAAALAITAVVIAIGVPAVVLGLKWLLEALR